MSTATTSTAPVASQLRAPGRATRQRYRTSFARTLRSEWIKVRSLRSTWWTLGITIVMMVLITLAMAFGQRSALSEEPTALPEVLVFSFIFAQMSIAVLGALTITGEHSTGMIRSTFAACPTRVPALWAKTLVTVAWTVVAAVLGLLASIAVAYPLLSGAGLMPDLTAATTLRVLGAFVAYLVLVAVLSLGVGAMIRHSAGAIFTLVALLFIVFIVAGMIPGQWASDLSQYLPMNLGMSMMSSGSEPGGLSPLAATLAMAGWAVVAQVGAAILMKRRDA